MALIRMRELSNCVMYACNEGGHFSQMMALHDLFSCFPSVLVTDNDRASKKYPALKDIDEIVLVRGTAERRKKVTGKETSNRIFYFVGYLKMFFECWGYYRRFRPRVIITTGSNIAVPLFLLGWLNGSKLVFIETRAKVYAKSLTGILVNKFADQVFVQWPEMLSLYPKAMYCGTLV